MLLMRKQTGVPSFGGHAQSTWVEILASSFSCYVLPNQLTPVGKRASKGKGASVQPAPAVGAASAEQDRVVSPGAAAAASPAVAAKSSAQKATPGVDGAPSKRDEAAGPGPSSERLRAVAKPLPRRATPGSARATARSKLLPVSDDEEEEAMAAAAAAPAAAEPPQQHEAVAGTGHASDDATADDEEEEEEEEDEQQQLDAFKQDRTLREALDRLQATIADASVFLRPNQEVSQTARQAAKVRAHLAPHPTPPSLHALLHVVGHGGMAWPPHNAVQELLSMHGSSCAAGPHGHMNARLGKTGAVLDMRYVPG